ncbi:MAG: TetR family transcriptional regulator [Pusillimonas sp.]|jgi:AcrR family transcriptional regulator|nr:TetR family transcriptional regulator [Pusillimonas sp.]|tara:strand:- start:315931 stop:316584 length:654 start_codon:yes stop_codon:yes gene_type:complete
MPTQKATHVAKTGRRTQEVRSREAKEKLLKATIDVLMRRGYSGLTTKEVATSAGLSNGALVHHYASKAELVIAATAAVYDECIERGQRVARTPEAIKNPIEGFMTDCLSVYFDWPYLAAIEIIVAARTDPQLMERIIPVMQNYRATTNTLWLKVFREAGYTPNQAKTILNLTLNMVRGLAVHRLWQQDQEYFDHYLKEWVKTIKNQFPLKRAPGQTG